MATESDAELRSEKRTWLLLTPVLLVVSVCHGVSKPNYWAATQALIDYRFGIIKRGLFGYLISDRFHFEIYSRFSHFAIFVILLAAALVLLISYFGGMRERLTTIEAAALYVSSYSMVYVAMSTGYFDSLLICLAIPLLFLRRPAVRLLAGLPVALVGVMVHEMFLIIYLPVLLLSFVLQAATEENKKKSSAILLEGGLLFLAVFVMVLMIAVRPSLTPAQVAQMQAQMQQSATFVVDPGVFQLMLRSTRDNMMSMYDHLFLENWWFRQVENFVLLVPTTVLLVLASKEVLRQSERPMPRWTLPCVIAAGLSPLLMHCVAWDVERWNAAAVLTTFLALIAVCRFTKGAVARLPWKLRHAIVLMIVLNLCMQLLDMESRAMRPHLVVQLSNR